MSRHHQFDPITVMHLSDSICVFGSRQIPSGWEAVEEISAETREWGSDESSAWWILCIVGQTQYLHWVVMARQTDCRLLGGQALHFKLTLAWLVIMTLSSRRIKRREKHNFLSLPFCSLNYACSVYCSDQIKFCAKTSVSCWIRGTLRDPNTIPEFSLPLILLACNHVSLTKVSGLADEPEPVAAARPRPAALVVPNVPAEADTPGQAVLLVTLLQPKLGPAKAVHLNRVFYKYKWSYFPHFFFFSIRV